MLPPTSARETLLNALFASAEGSTSVLAIVSSGSFLGRANRACRAASLADFRDSRGKGEGKVAVSWFSYSSTALFSGAIEDWFLLLGVPVIWRVRMQHAGVDIALGDEDNNCPLHCCNRNLFIEYVRFLPQFQKPAEEGNEKRAWRVLAAEDFVALVLSKNFLSYAES